MFLLVNVFSNPLFGAHHVIELVAGFPNHRFFSINSQNCDQGIILKEKRRLFQLRKKNPIWMEAFPSLLGLEKKLGEGLFSNDQGLGFFFLSRRTTGRPPSRYWSLLTFF